MRLIFALLSVALWCGQALADVVVLNNGDRLTGKVDGITGGKLVLVTQYAGGVRIKLDAIASVETEAEFDVRAGDERLTGRLTTDEEGQILVGATRVPISNVAVASQNNLRLGGFGSSWSSRADVSMVISNGNSDTESLNTLIESTLKRERSQHKASLLISKEEAEEETTKDQTDFDYGYKRFMTEKWYLAGNFEYFKDELKDIDQRLTLGAGAGYQFWDNSLGALSTELGVSAVREEVDGEGTENNPALRWAVDYNRFLFAKKLEFFHNHSVLFIPDSDEGEVLDSSTGLRYALNDRIDTTARVDVTHETEPEPGNSKTDVTYTLGVGIKF